jgi:hypothetical protein
MGLLQDRHRDELRASGWRTRGYSPHFDGIAAPQSITINLADAIPQKVVQRWKEELRISKSERERILLQRRIDRYLDQGYGEAELKCARIATMVQNSLLEFAGTRYTLLAWVVMPNHVHSLVKRFEDYELSDTCIRLSLTRLMKPTRFFTTPDSFG